MVVIKGFLKLLLIPVITAFALAEMAVSFLVALLSYLMGLSDGPEALRMLAAAFLFWGLPYIGSAIVGVVAADRAFAEDLFLK